MSIYIIYYEYNNILEGHVIKYLKAFTTYGKEVFTTNKDDASIFINKNKANRVIKRHTLSHCKILKLIK